MNSRKIKMYTSIYEYLLLLREPLTEFLMLSLQKVYKENWWEQAVVSAYKDNKNDNSKQRYEKEKVRYEIYQSVIQSLEIFDFSELLNILMHNWQKIFDKSIKPNILFKIKDIRNVISHPNETNLSAAAFKKFIFYIKEFSVLINAQDILSGKLDKYLAIPYKVPKNQIDENDKCKRILELIEREVITPALNCSTLPDDIKESLVRTLIRFEINNSLEDINEFFHGALGSSRGQEVYTQLHANKLKAMEDIRKEYNEIYLS